MTDNLNKGHKAFEMDFGDGQTFEAFLRAHYQTEDHEARIANKDNNHG